MWSFDRVSAWLRWSSHKSVPRFTVTGVFFKQKGAAEGKVSVQFQVAGGAHSDGDGASAPSGQNDAAKVVSDSPFRSHNSIKSEGTEMKKHRNDLSGAAPPQGSETSTHAHLQNEVIPVRKEDLPENHQRPNWTQISPPFV